MLTLCGVLCTSAAIWVGRDAHLERTAKLDFIGTRILGTAEPLGPDAYRIRYTHPASGTIYSSIVRGTFPGGEGAIGKQDVRLIYNPADPAAFQVAGLSYIPGAITAALVLGAILCVSYARRMFLKNIPKRTTERA